MSLNTLWWFAKFLIPIILVSYFDLTNHKIKTLL